MLTCELRTRRRYDVQHHLSGSPRLLCVDDDPDIHTTIAARMKALGIEVLPAFHGMQGVSVAVNECPDVILMDLAMPNGNGEYFVQCVKQNPATSQIPIVVLTGMRDPALRRRFKKLGVDAYLTKPICSQEVADTIQVLLRQV